MLEDDDVNEVEQRLLLLVRMRVLGRRLIEDSWLNCQRCWGE